MRDVAESDWKLFKKMLPQWQERYMEKLIGQDIKSYAQHWIGQ